jgi:hypothetical protein
MGASQGESASCSFSRFNSLPTQSDTNARSLFCIKRPGVCIDEQPANYKELWLILLHGITVVQPPAWLAYHGSRRV